MTSPAQRPDVDYALERLHAAESARDQARVPVEHWYAQRRAALRALVTSATLTLVGIGVAIVDGTLVPVNTLAPLGEIAVTMGLLGVVVSILGYVVVMCDTKIDKRRRELAGHVALVRDRERRLLEVTS